MSFCAAVWTSIEPAELYMHVAAVFVDLLLCFHALQPAKRTVVMKSNNLSFRLFYTCAAVFFAGFLWVPTNRASSFHSISHVWEATCHLLASRVVFHASFVTAWPLSDVTKHSPPLLLFQQTPSPFKTRGPPPPTLLHATPPITTTAQNHSTTCRV